MWFAKDPNWVIGSFLLYRLGHQKDSFFTHFVAKSFFHSSDTETSHYSPPVQSMIDMLQDQDITPPSTPSLDRVEVIKLPSTNGSPSGISYNSGASDGASDTPLNLSLKPSTVSTGGASSSLTSLSNMSANIGTDRICK